MENLPPRSKGPHVDPVRYKLVTFNYDASRTFRRLYYKENGLWYHPKLHRCRPTPILGEDKFVELLEGRTTIEAYNRYSDPPWEILHIETPTEAQVEAYLWTL